MAALVPVAVQGAETDYQAVQRNAMAMARSGQFPQAIADLEKILEQHPDDRRTRRDLMAVYAWSGNCRRSLKLYRQFKRDEVDDRVSITVVTGCLIKEERYREASTLLKVARQKYAYDRKILDLDIKARAELKKKKLWYTQNGIELGSSDIGGNRVVFESELARELNDSTSLVARLILAHEYDPAFGTGNLKRLGAGFEHRFYGGVSWRAEASANIDGKTDPGLDSRLEYPVNDKLEVSAEYTTYAEDISLPAIGTGITSDRFSVNSEFHNEGYAFEGTASVRQYRFSDSNLRQGASVDLSYAYSRRDEHWRRVGLEIDHETNTYLGATYFNPADGNSMVAYHSWEIPGKSKRFRHADKLTLKAGMYAQAGYSTEAIAEIAYEQDFSLSDDSSISASYSLASNVYDGVREADAIVAFSYERSF